MPDGDQLYITLYKLGEGGSTTGILREATYRRQDDDSYRLTATLPKGDRDAVPEVADRLLERIRKVVEDKLGPLEEPREESADQQQTREDGELQAQGIAAEVAELGEPAPQTPPAPPEPMDLQHHARQIAEGYMGEHTEAEDVQREHERLHRFQTLAATDEGRPHALRDYAVDHSLGLEGEPEGTAKLALLRHHGASDAEIDAACDQYAAHPMNQLERDSGYEPGDTKEHHRAHYRLDGDTWQRVKGEVN